MPKTRQQIQIAAMNLNDETEDKPGYATAAFIYNTFIDEGADALAQMGALYVNAVTDIVSGQSKYTLPTLYRIDQIVAMWQSGSATRPLAQLTPFDMDVLYQGWRTQPATGWPTTAVFEGQSSVTLYPQPDYTIGSGASLTVNISGGIVTTITVNAGGTGYGTPTVAFSDATGSGAAATLTVANGVITTATVTAGGSGYASPTAVIHTGGLLIQGYGVPSMAGAAGTNLWPLPSSVCPLTQANADDAIMYYAAMRRCSQHPSPDNQVRKSDWAAAFETHSRNIYKEIMNANRAIRTATSMDASSGGQWGGTGY